MAHSRASGSPARSARRSKLAPTPPPGCGCGREATSRFDDDPSAGPASRNRAGQGPERNQARGVPKPRFCLQVRSIRDVNGVLAPHTFFIAFLTIPQLSALATSPAGRAPPRAAEPLDQEHDVACWELSSGQARARPPRSARARGHRRPPHRKPGLRARKSAQRNRGYSRFSLFALATAAAREEQPSLA